MKIRGVLILLMLVSMVSKSQNLVFKSDVCKALRFPNQSVTLAPSWIKHREDLNVAYLVSLDPDRLLHNFRINAGLSSNAQPLEGWEAPYIGLRGHFVGHYLSAMSSIVEKNQDNRLLSERLNYMVTELGKCQQVFGTGYLSAFPESDFDILETKFDGVWAPYYTYHKIMQGLLDVFERTGNKRAYEMVIGMASYTERRISKLDEETIRKLLYTTAANPANEAGAMSEVLYRLYKISKDSRHLALAKVFDPSWFFVPLSKNIDILSGLHANTHLVLVNGFAERYTVTKEVLFRDAAVNFWTILMNNHAYVNGSSSGPRPNVTTPTSLSAEHWGVPGHLSSTMTKEIAESCVSHNTQKLTSSLFQWTTDAKYADAYMNTFYNSILALQSAQNGSCVYHLPLGSPRKKMFLKENDFRCCNGTTIEAFSLLNSGVYYFNDTTLWVNLYIPSEVNWTKKNLSLRQTGNFPTDSVVDLTISAKNKSTFSINLLVPSWAQGVDIYINNEKQNVNPAPNSYISLNHKWKDNDKIKLIFHYQFHLKSMSDDENVIAIFYGPVLLAFENDSELILKGDHNIILSNLAVQGNNTFSLLNNGRKYVLRPLYNIEDQSYGVYATIRNY
ncbi:MAG TPA: beta-L-arabinofuranosidase domain-containing protein [Cyclobacteriaceae bacterium]